MLNGLGWNSYYYNDNDRDGTKWEDPTEQVAAAKKSINDFGGFYIARYEAGWPGDTSTDTYPTDSIKNVNTGTPVSKKGNVSWNYISQENAKEVSENMVDKPTVKSYLVDSQAWNVICKNILIPKKSDNLVLNDSTTWGNYYDSDPNVYDGLNGFWAQHAWTTSWTVNKYNNGQVNKDLAPNGGKIPGTENNRIELATGLSDTFKVYNIYDMAGNMWEWTTETQELDNQKFAVLRGGSFSPNGISSPVVRANGNTLAAHYDVNVGFRVVLYAK